MSGLDDIESFTVCRLNSRFQSLPLEAAGSIRRSWDFVSDISELSLCGKNRTKDDCDPVEEMYLLKMPPFSIAMTGHEKLDFSVIRPNFI
jgi:hypothetical protein